MLVDATRFQSADDFITATTHYGGRVLVGEIAVNPSGTDRDSWNVFDAISAEIMRQLGVATIDPVLAEEVQRLVEARAKFGVELDPDCTVRVVE